MLFFAVFVIQDSLYEYNQKQRVLRLWGKRVTQVTALAAQFFLGRLGSNIYVCVFIVGVNRANRQTNDSMCVSCLFGPSLLAPTYISRLCACFF